MVIALRADLEVLLELRFGHHLPATRTLGPQSFRNIALASHANLERRLLENSHGYFLSARNRDDNHGGGPRFPQDPGTGIGGRTRGQDIIDEGNGQPFYLRTTAQGKSALQIPKPFFPVKIRLRERVARPPEAITDRQTKSPSGQVSQHSGLIEFPLALASGMERHRDERLGSHHLEPMIAKSLGQHPGQQMTKVHLAVVFELVDQLANHAPAPVSRGGEIEGQRAVTAVHAAECRRERTTIRLTTDRATRSDRAFAGAAAGSTKAGRGSRKGNTAARAVGRIEQPGGSFKPSATRPGGKHDANRAGQEDR
jgi:hypothetical protein